MTTRDEIIEAATRKNGALDNLKSGQREIGWDGSEVVVPRQALDEMLAAFDALTAQPLEPPCRLNLGSQSALPSRRFAIIH